MLVWPRERGPEKCRPAPTGATVRGAAEDREAEAREDFLARALDPPRRKGPRRRLSQGGSGFSLAEGRASPSLVRSRVRPRESIERRDTHLDSLIDRLREPRVRRILEPILAGELLAPDVLDDDVQCRLA